MTSNERSEPQIYPASHSAVSLLTAIEILSPTQAFDAVASKTRKLYLPAGVQSAWLIIPSVKSIYVFSADGDVGVHTTGTLRDPATQVELSLEKLFK